MRSTLLVTLAFIILVSGFFIYQKLVSKPVAQGSESSGRNERAPLLTNGPKIQHISNGSGAWYDVFGVGKENGRLKSKFRAAEYMPQENGQIAVTTPEAWFYMPNGQKMRLTGVDGEVVMPDAPAASPGTQILGGAPSRGRIHTVTVELFNMFPDSKPNVPDETMTTDNIDFDNVTMLIATKQYVDSAGKVIASDEAPVHVRSNAPTRGYDLDGRGMKLRWNDQDGRLELLEIDHGEWLMIKDTSSSGMFGGAGRPAKSPASPPAAPLAQGAAPAVPAPHGAAPAPPSASASAAPSAAPASSAPAHQEPPPIPVPYVATFYENVHITQGPDVNITADRMDVDFVNRQEKQPPTTAPALTATGSTKPPLAPAPDSRPPEIPTPATQPAREPAPAHAVAAAQPGGAHPTATTTPATQPSSPPVMIYWTGRLHMEPANGRRPKVMPGDAVVELNGMPVTVHRVTPGQQDGDDIRAARLVYHTTDGAVKLFNSASVPLVLIRKLVNGQIDPKQMITTETLDYAADPAGIKVATLTGAGHALMPMESTGGKPGNAAKGDPKKDNTSTAPGTGGMMDAHWKKGAKVYFTSKGQGAKAGQAGQDQLDVEHVDLSGDVDVKHPQLVMNSQALSLYFEPPAKPTTRPAVAADVSVPGTSATTRPTDASTALGTGPGKPQQELKKVVATEKVHCELMGQNGKKQIIDCIELEMHTARSDDGKFYARTINTRGNVHAYDGEQDLYAGKVDLTLKPARPEEKKTNPPARGALARATLAETQPAKQQSDTTAVDLERMIASDNVRVVNKDGSVAIGSQLMITTEQNEQHVLVAGSSGFAMQSLDFGNALVIDSKMNMLSGPIISIDPKEGIAHVVGPGAMHVTQEQTDEAKQRPMVVAWIDRADMNGPANRIDVDGNVAVQTRDTDGTVNNVTGDHVLINLLKKAAPATKPATEPAAQVASAVTHAPPSTRPAKKGQAPDSMQMDVMKDKDVRAITIESDSPRQAKVVSVLTGPDGKDLRQLLLVAPRIIYQLVDAKDQPAKTLIVPSAGQMLVGDHRPAEKPKDASAKAGDDTSSSRGITAFRWARSLTYTEQRHEAIMVQDVYVRHRPDATGASEIEVRHADQVNALFEPTKVKAKPAIAPATIPATKPAAKPADPEAAMQLTRLIADGNVAISRAGSNLFADQIDYDPITHWMIARGRPNHLVQYEDPDPKKSMTAEQMEWNTETWNMKMSASKASHPK